MVATLVSVGELARIGVTGSDSDSLGLSGDGDDGILSLDGLGGSRSVDVRSDGDNDQVGVVGGGLGGSGGRNISGGGSSLSNDRSGSGRGSCRRVDSRDGGSGRGGSLSLGNGGSSSGSDVGSGRVSKLRELSDQSLSEVIEGGQVGLSAGEVVLLVIGASSHGGVGGSRGDDVTSRKLHHGSPNILLDLGLLGALGVLGLSVEGELLALFNDSRWVSASVDSTLEYILLPSVHEVSVVTVSSGISVGEDESSSLSGNSVDVPDSLEKQRRNTDGVSRRALSVVHGVGVGHVGTVIGRVDVLSIPARGEEDLSTETVNTESVLGNGVQSKSGLGGLVVVQAVESNGLLAEEGLVGGQTGRGPEGLLKVGPGEVTEPVVASNDAQVGRERLDVVSTLKVVADVC
jgi:hypothetical protein